VVGSPERGEKTNLRKMRNARRPLERDRMPCAENAANRASSRVFFLHKGGGVEA